MINVAYDRILVYDEYDKPLFPYPNLGKYKPYGHWHFDFKNLDNLLEQTNFKLPIKLRNGLSIELEKFARSLDGQNLSLAPINGSYLHLFTMVKLQDIIKTNEPFIYPVMVHSLNFFKNNPIIDLPVELINPLKKYQAKLLFVQNFEGDFGMNETDFIFFKNLSKKYNIDKSQIIMITGNLKIKEIYDNREKEDKVFTAYPHSWFHTFNWGENIFKDFNYFSTSNKNNKKLFHFLCFNLRVRPHRLCIFGELQTNTKLLKKCVVSLFGTDNKQPYNINNFYNIISSFLSDDYKHNKLRLLEFYKNYDSTMDFIYDEGITPTTYYGINKEAHSNTFVNIVTETQISSETIFLSEKIFKPIYSLQPFIMIGSPNSLKKLKELGFKTFDKWWDESYDEETDFTKRFEKIIDVMEIISEWSLDECYKITQEMQTILNHNFDVLFKNKEEIKLVEFFQSEKKISKKLI